MSTIDNRVVKMAFDNAQFEKNAGTSLHTIEKLKQALNFKGAAKGLDDLNAKSRSVKMDALVDGVQTVADKFNALGVVGFTVLQNLTNRAVDAGTRIASALTIEPIKMGFEEYETQINAVQTILANTQDKLKEQGLDEQGRLDKVNEKLDELNTYADKTIYNFTEMTRNIGTFTAAGVELDTATNAIQGIANLAAVSGSTSQQASTAMYQLSQALASGTVKLQDWNSVVNAGMGGQLFQDQLKDTARAHGIAVDEMIDKNGSFRDSLREGWLTSEVLTETLEKFTSTTEGLTEEEINLQREMWRTRGYTDEQIDSIFELGKMSTDAATKVKTFTQLIDTTKEALQSGWTQSWEYIIGDFGQAKELWTGISDVLNDYIGKSADARNAVLKEWNEAEGGRKAVLEGLSNAFKALLTVMEPIKEAWDSVFPSITARQLIEFSTKFKEFTATLALNEEQMEKLKNGFTGVFSIIKSVIDFISRTAVAAFDALKTILASIFPKNGSILDSFSSFGDVLKYFADKLDKVNTVADGIRKLGDVIASFIEKAKEFLKLDEIGDKFQDFISKLKNSGGEGGFGALDKLSSIFEKIKETAEKALPVIKDKFDEIREALANFVKGFSSEAGKFDGLDIIGALGIGASGLGIAKIAGIFKKVDDLVEDTKGFKKHLEDIKDAVIDTFGAIQLNLKADALKSIAIAIGILAVSLLVISGIDTNKLLPSLAALSVLIAEVNFLMNSLSDISVKKINTGIITAMLIGIAGAILILAVAMRVIGGMDTDAIIKGLISVTVLLKVLTTVASELSGMEKDMIKGASTLIAMAVAITLLAIPIKLLGSMDLESLGKGLISVIALIVSLAAALKIISTEEGSLKKASSTLLMMALAINLLVIPVKILGDMDLESLAKGLGSVLAMILALAVALRIIPKDASDKALAIFALAGAVAVMGAAVKILGGMDVFDLAKGLGAVAIMLTILGVAAKAIEKDLAGIEGILLLATALIPLAVALKILSTIPLLDLVKGIAAIAATLFVFAVAAEVLAPVAPILTVISLALLAFGAAVALVGIGIFALSVAITTSGAAILAFVTALLAMLPLVGVMLAKAFVGFITTIAEMLPQILEAVASIITGILTVLGEQIPLVVELVLSLLNTLLEKLLEYIPHMAETGLQIILGLLNALAEHMPEIVQAGMDVAIGFINGVTEKLPELIDAAFKLIIGFIDGLATAIDENHNALFDAVGHLIESIVNAIIDLVFKVGDSAGELITGEGGILDALAGGISQLFEAGANLVQGFIDGLTSMPGALWDAACGLANDAWNAITGTLDEHSPSRLTFGGGANFTQGFIDGILSLKKEAVNQTAGVAYAAMDAFDSAIETDYQPTITPVMDLTNIQNGIGSMNSMIDAIPSTYGINAAIDSQNALNQQAMQMLGAGNDYSSILNGMLGLRDDLAKYSDVISKMQLVMDTGTVVGALTPGIDRQLGRNAILAGRGVV